MGEPRSGCAPPEEWRPVPDTVGLEVSDRGRGRLWVKEETVPLRRYDCGRGFYGVTVDGRSRYVHELVALAFLGLRPPGCVIDHVDGLRTNNRAENLEYVTPGESQRRAYARGSRQVPQGERHHRARLTEADVRQIRAQPWIRVVMFARLFGVTSEAVSAARNRKTWKHLL
jgi:hypothetical protein